VLTRQSHPPGLPRPATPAREPHHRRAFLDEGNDHTQAGFGESTRSAWPACLPDVLGTTRTQGPRRAPRQPNSTSRKEAERAVPRTESSSPPTPHVSNAGPARTINAGTGSRQNACPAPQAGLAHLHGRPRPGNHASVEVGIVEGGRGPAGKRTVLTSEGGHAPSPVSRQQDGLRSEHLGTAGKPVETVGGHT
jgi:hypothetical protein